MTRRPAKPAAADPLADTRVRFVRTSGPTDADPTTYHVGSEWMLPADRAAAAIAAGDAVPADAPDAPTPSAHPDAAAAADEE